MDAYREFSAVYDELMDNVPYGQWCERLQELIEKYGVSKPERDAEDALASERNLVLDLGCGTGTLTELMYRKGYDMIGVDNSEVRLEIAMEKRQKSGHDILYLLQDMQAFELYGTVGGIVSVCDSINYVTDEKELKEVFSLVNNYLDPRGIFVFDFNTEYKYRELLGDRVIAEEREECSFIWDNFYDAEEGINEYDLTVFVREEGGLFRKFEETHYQRGYSLEQILRLTKQAGLAVVEAMDADTGEAVTEKSERIYLVAKCGKKF